MSSTEFSCLASSNGRCTAWITCKVRCQLGAEDRAPASYEHRNNACRIIGTPPTLPTDSQARKDTPIARGCLDYFPLAIAAIARLSKAGNDKHNPGEPLHWSRGKSNDHADCIARHLLERGTVDPDDGFPHSVKLAWRALALCQEELEKAAG